MRRRGDSFVEPFAAGQMAIIRGRAFAGDRGIQQVEFSADDGETWRDVRIDYPGTNLTWTFWSADWLPEEPGEYTLVSRATDGTGAPTAERDARHRAAGSHRVPSRRGDGWVIGCRGDQGDQGTKRPFDRRR